MIEPAQQELAEAEHGLDDTEDRFRDVLTPAVALIRSDRFSPEDGDAMRFSIRTVIPTSGA
jgi:hypothetical protein